jgi:hypothetical protein
MVKISLLPVYQDYGKKIDKDIFVPAYIRLIPYLNGFLIMYLILW